MLRTNVKIILFFMVFLLVIFKVFIFVSLLLLKLKRTIQKNKILLENFVFNNDTLHTACDQEDMECSTDQKQEEEVVVSYDTDQKQEEEYYSIDTMALKACKCSKGCLECAYTKKGKIKHCEDCKNCEDCYFRKNNHKDSYDLSNISNGDKYLKERELVLSMFEEL